MDDCKDAQEKWINPDINLSESDEDSDREKSKGKKTIGEEKAKEK